MTLTKEQIAEARECAELLANILEDGNGPGANAIRVLLATITPNPGPPRPDDMAELARLVAKELRSHGINAWANNVFVNVGRGHFTPYAMVWSDFDNLTPRECADVIQAEEAKRAAEWAGDK